MNIYLITNTVNGKVYVGKTEQKPHRRWLEHLRDSVKRPRLAPLLYRAMHKYGVEHFVFEVVCQASTIEQLNRLEQLWIWVLRAAEGAHGYNLTLGGTGGSPNAATLEKLRKPKSEGHKAACSAAAKLRGTAHMNTLEARNRRGMKLKGRVFSDATRAKMSEAAKVRAAANPGHLCTARAARLPQQRSAAGTYTSRAEGR